jgi:hypothetical protein
LHHHAGDGARGKDGGLSNRGSYDAPSAAVRIRALKRDKYKCTYCGVSGNEAELEVDHIIPKSKGGSHHIANLTTACRKCNQKKSNRPMQPTIQHCEPIGLVGLYAMLFDDEGYMKYNGYVAGIFERFALFQYFSAVTGSPTEIEAIPIEKLLDPKQTKLFQHKDVAEIYYEREARRLEVRYEKRRAEAMVRPNSCL